jgi:hypothetical protein
MGDHKRRLNKLEQEAQAGDELPWLTLKQDLDDQELYRAPDGTEHRRPFTAFEGLYNIIVIEYERNWRGDDDGIQLKWPEDE